MTAVPNDFDAAKIICDALKDLDKERQQRVLRWVAESLEISLHVRTERHTEVLTPPPPSSPAGAATVAVQQNPGTDIKTFVESKSPRSDNQFATVIAYFYRFEARASEQKDAISPEDLQNATRLAGRSRLANPLNTLNNAKKQGYLDSAERGNFKINSVGENLVAMTLPSANGGAKAPSPRRKAPTKKSATPKQPKAKAKK